MPANLQNASVFIDSIFPDPQWMVTSSLLYDRVLLSEFFNEEYFDLFRVLHRGYDEYIEYVEKMISKIDAFDTKILSKLIVLDSFSFRKTLEGEDITGIQSDIDSISKGDQSNLIYRKELDNYFDEIFGHFAEVVDSGQMDAGYAMGVLETIFRGAVFESYYKYLLGDVDCFSCREVEFDSHFNVTPSILSKSIEAIIPVNVRSISIDQIIDFRGRHAHFQKKERFIEAAQKEIDCLVNCSSEEAFNRSLKNCKKLIEDHIKQLELCYKKTKIDIAKTVMGVVSLSPGPAVLISLLDSTVFSPLITATWVTSSLMMASSHIQTLKEKGELDIGNSKWAYLYYLDKEFSK